MIINFDLRAALSAARNSVAALSRDQAGDASVTALDTLLAGIDGAAAEPAPEQEEEAQPDEEDAEPDAAAEPDHQPDVILGQPHKPKSVWVAEVKNPREPAPVQAEPAEGRVWTPERDAKLLEMKADPGRSWQQITEALNALPGLAIASANATQMRFFKLRRAGQVPAPSPLASVPVEDMAEARQMMTASSSVGAKALADYFGWTLELAQQVATAIRAELDGGAK
jgi:hypothetical protein